MRSSIAALLVLILAATPSLARKWTSANGARSFEGELVESKDGTVTLHTDGTFSYVADENFDGVDQFSYRVLDGVARWKPVTDQHIVGTVKIYAANDLMRTNNDFFVIKMGETRSIAP